MILLFLLFFEVFCYGEYLIDFINPALVECIDDDGENGWSSIINGYFTPIMTPWAEKEEYHEFPDSLPDEIREKFKKGIKCGVYSTQYDPYFEYLDTSGGYIWKGSSIDLLRKCVLPRIQQKYDISDDDFKYEFSVQLMEGNDFFDFIYNDLENEAVDFFVAITKTNRRAVYVDFSQFILVNRNVCIRTAYDPDKVLTDFASYNNSETSIVCEVGSPYEFISQRFNAANLSIISDPQTFFQSLAFAPRGHIYCSDVVPLEYWIRKNSYENNFTFVDDTIVRSSDDRYGWAFKKVDREQKDLFSMIAKICASLFIPLLLCSCCIIICFFLLFLGSACLFGVVWKKKQEKLHYFEQLKDFQILLDEQKAEEDLSQISIKVNKKFFEISYSDVVLKAQISEGGSGAIVYKATWNNHDVAFKVFRVQSFSIFDSETGKRIYDFELFQREVSIMSSIASPYILQCFGACIKVPRIGIVMEYCENGSLRSYFEFQEATFVSSSPSFSFTKEKHLIGEEDDNNQSFSRMTMIIPIHEKVRMMKEICKGMEYLRKREILHRDLKPSNVLIDSLKTCKLCDFGSSRFIQRNEGELTSRIGTSFYMSPEITTGSSCYSYKSDIYSFGIVFYVILFHQFDDPFKASYKKGDGRRRSHVEFLAANDPQFRPVIPPFHRELQWCVRLMKRCWAHNPQERPSWRQIIKKFEKHEKKDKLLLKNSSSFSSLESVRKQNNNKSEQQNNKELLRKKEEEEEEENKEKDEKIKRYERIIFEQNELISSLKKDLYEAMAEVQKKNKKKQMDSKKSSWKSERIKEQMNKPLLFNEETEINDTFRIN